MTGKFYVQHSLLSTYIVQLTALFDPPRTNRFKNKYIGSFQICLVSNYEAKSSKLLNRALPTEIV